ncbi:hypothetical protein GCM10007981_02110 [Thermocladium modestius]|uniref:Uncharacterized protein n=1 Tax=Thermocladium modestius TaxID=62609 RepID=A0A830GRT6_9CREN|nr:hypothetical protein [Thermocladium modestius]GGP19237.1 hypothetical protein GCM10007981_02110 [Thermocladium modestius]
MPRKSKKEKGSDASITSFLFPSPGEEQRQVSGPGGIADDLLSFIVNRGGVSKEELMAWGKERGLSMAKLLSAVEQLTAAGLLIKKLDERGKLMYKARGGSSNRHAT